MTYSIETETCSRCCGTGRFGPIVVHQGICFKCEGTGKQYTRAGAKIAALYDAARHATIETLPVGTRVIVEGFTAGGFTVPSQYATITEISETSVSAEYADGTASLGYGCTVKLPKTREEKQAILAALAPRAGLLLDGEPTKPSRSRKSAEDKEAARMIRNAARREKVAAERRAELASEKQIAFIARLLTERGSDGDLSKITKIDAGLIIDRLLAS